MTKPGIEADRVWVKSELGLPFGAFCNRWRDRSSLSPSNPDCEVLYIGDEALGWLHGQALLRVRKGLQAISQATGQAVGQANEQPCDATGPIRIPLHQAQNTLAELGRWLHQQQWVPAWRDELQTVNNQKGEKLFDLERGLFKILGLRSQAVHIHIETPDGLIWIGRRSLQKKENPGMLDNLSAGGVGANEAPWDCVWRELNEEAGLKPDWVELTQAGEPLLVSRPIEMGWHHETIYLFRGIVPRNWTPSNRDGEVQGFELMTPKACQDAVNQWRFTPDAGLVTALLMSRHQAIQA